MALKKERLNELAMLALQAKLELNGDIRLNPRTIKQEARDSAKKIGVEPAEAAELMKVLIQAIVDRMMAKLDKVIKKGNG